ncbi:restriction endonuclease subunit S [Streptomyces sp. DSM 41987]|uniref:restriction endonuclease subunit S n=1 Tax=Streptomyces TaxID=1883 RepID=UPI003605D473
MTWPTTKLKWAATTVAGGTPSVADPSNWADGEDGTAWISISDMSGSSSVASTNRRVTAEGVAEARLPIGEPGTLILSMYASLGHTAFLAVRASWNQAIIGIYASPSQDPRFLKYALDAIKPTLSEIARSNTQANLNAEQVGNLAIPNPPLEEQRRIADFLDAETACIDHITGMFATFRKLLAERMLALSEEAVGKLVSPFRGGVRIKSICRAVDVRAGFLADSLPLLSVSIHHGVTPRSEMTDRVARAESLENYKVCATGDIILNRMRAFQGAVGVSRQDGLVSPDYLILRPGEDMAGDLLHHVFRSPRFVGEMASRIRGIGSVDQGNVRTPRINWEDFGDIRLHIPPVADQGHLLSTLGTETAQHERLRSKINDQLSLLAERRQALITAAVTGQFDVSTASGRNVTNGANEQP